MILNALVFRLGNNTLQDSLSVQGIVTRQETVKIVHKGTINSKRHFYRLSYGAVKIYYYNNYRYKFTITIIMI